VKWGGPVVSMLLLATWIGSGWRHFGLETPRGNFAFVMAGQISIGQQRPFTSSISYHLWYSDGSAF